MGNKIITRVRNLSINSNRGSEKVDNSKTKLPLSQCESGTSDKNYSSINQTTNDVTKRKPSSTTINNLGNFVQTTNQESVEVN